MARKYNWDWRLLALAAILARPTRWLMEVSYLYLKEQWAPELDMKEAMRVAPYLLLAVLQETIEYIASNFSPEFLTLVVVSISGFALYFAPVDQDKEVRVRHKHEATSTSTGIGTGTRAPAGPAPQACPILPLRAYHALAPCPLRVSPHSTPSARYRRTER